MDIECKGNSVRIEQDGPITRVFIDELEVQGLKSVSFDSDDGWIPKVTITFNPKSTNKITEAK